MSASYELTLTDDEMERMAQEDPRRLADILLQERISPYEATFGAEFLGRYCGDASFVKKVLFELLSREPSQLREGVVYGLGHYIEDQDVVDALTARWRVESSPGVLAAIEAYLDLD